jgi:hypothetical protein
MDPIVFSFISSKEYILNNKYNDVNNDKDGDKQLSNDNNEDINIDNFNNDNINIDNFNNDNNSDYVCVGREDYITETDGIDLLDNNSLVEENNEKINEKNYEIDNAIDNETNETCNFIHLIACKKGGEKFTEKIISIEEESLNSEIINEWIIKILNGDITWNLSDEMIFPINITEFD